MTLKKNKAGFSLFPILVILILSSLVSCTRLFSHSEAEPSRVKLPANEAVIKNLEVSKVNLKIALGNELKTSQLRAVEVFQNASGFRQNFPSFRLFDVAEGSVYAILGLQNADVLVAINESAVVSPQVIGQVVRLLPNEKGVTFEIIREGKSTLIKVRFI